MSDECFVDFVLEPETENGIVICTIEASALVIHNEPSHSDDLDFAISGYYISGCRWENDGYINDENYTPLPNPIISVLVEHEETIKPQLEENLIKKLEVGPRPYEHELEGFGMNAGRVL